MVLGGGVRCDVDIFKLTDIAQSINREVCGYLYEKDNVVIMKTFINIIRYVILKNTSINFPLQPLIIYVH